MFKFLNGKFVELVKTWKGFNIYALRDLRITFYFSIENSWKNLWKIKKIFKIVLDKHQSNQIKIYRRIWTHSKQKDHLKEQFKQSISKRLDFSPIKMFSDTLRKYCECESVYWLQSIFSLVCSMYSKLKSDNYLNL